MKHRIGTIAITAAALLGLAACGGGKAAPSEASVQESAWAGCFVFGDDGTYINDIWQQQHDQTITTAEALQKACGMSITKLDDGWVLAARDGMRQGSLGAAVRRFGDETGCLGDLDYTAISQTRALDGRVESTNGRSSWTFHPDDGLNLICKA